MLSQKQIVAIPLVAIGGALRVVSDVGQVAADTQQITQTLKAIGTQSITFSVFMPDSCRMREVRRKLSILFHQNGKQIKKGKIP